MYGSYYKLLMAGTRSPAKLDYDRHRAAVDAILYGTYASEICFAALSLDGSGLLSYDPISIQLKDVAIASRATVLEENSYTFVRRQGLTPGMAPPRGFMAAWDQRDILAAVKVEPRLDAHTDVTSFPALLLYSSGDRQHDSYVEVHIYGSFDFRAVERVSVPKSLNRPPNQPLVRMLEEYVGAKDAVWEEV